MISKTLQRHVSISLALAISKCWINVGLCHLLIAVYCPLKYLGVRSGASSAHVVLPAVQIARNDLYLKTPWPKPVRAAISAMARHTYHDIGELPSDSHNPEVVRELLVTSRGRRTRPTRDWSSRRRRNPSISCSRPQELSELALG
jgi:hypothetical protein